MTVRLRVLSRPRVNAVFPLLALILISSMDDLVIIFTIGLPALIVGLFAYGLYLTKGVERG
jgi:hypothetical protein